MAKARAYLIIMVTTPSRRIARSLAQAALESRLIACANIVPAIESHYWWQGRITTGKESLLLLKTSQTHLKQLERLILKKHPYDTPEFIALPIAHGSKAYLKWLASRAAVRQTSAGRRWRLAE
jgi:periplasmic divalent cation tolerance protein